MKGGDKKKREQPHATRKGWLKNGNHPGDFNKAPRCGAQTRKGKPCQAPAMSNGRCRMHGGKSTGAPLGNTNALRHGLYTKEMLDRQKKLRQFLKNCTDTLNSL